MSTGTIYDLAVIGGGINGAGVPRDAASRGLKVCLCKRADLCSATSSASTKLIRTRAGIRMTPSELAEWMTRERSRRVERPRLQTAVA